MKSNYSKLLPACLAMTLVMACGFSVNITPSPSNPANPNAYNTAIAQTAAARGVDPSAFATSIAQTAAAAAPLSLPGGNTSVAPPAAPTNAAPTSAAPPNPAPSDKQAIQQALAAQLGWNAADTQVTVTASDGRVAYGTVVQTGAAGGAAWFAAKDAGGKWVIVHTGQSWPLCSAIQPYNFPASYIPNCEDASGQIVDRAAGGNPPPPSNPPAGAPTQADVFAPNPLGPLWSSLWFRQGECFDMDETFPAATPAACDLKLDANNIFTPQNGALFDPAPLQYVPSLNVCKAASFSAAAFDAINVTYVCFKTNAGKYGFFIPREILAEGILFDAYVFP